MNINKEDHQLWAKVAKLYYENDLTQGEIANKLGYSRVKIHRILRSAKEAGIVQVQINTLDSSATDLENQLIHKYDLRDCIVVEDYPPGDDLYLSLARASGGWLKSRIKSGMRIGLGLGRTISYLPHAFGIEKEVPCIFTEVAGAVSDHSWGIESNNIASQMAEIFGGKAELFYAPTLVSSPALKEQLIKERSVKKSLERARNCDVILQSVGPVDETAILFLQGYLSISDLDLLKTAGAVGDALGCFYDRDGQILPSPTDDLMIGLHLSELLDIPWSLLIAGGPEKIIPIDAALKGKYFNVLITNISTANDLTVKE
jgi:DNA-binding transcriptional regulator LsrR (DeoR family)